MTHEPFPLKSQTAEAKIEADRDINKALETGWQGLDIAEIVPLDQIAHDHELVSILRNRGA